MQFSKKVRPLMCETTALGAAIAAGSAEGIRKWDVKTDTAVPSDIFLPSISENGNYFTVNENAYRYFFASYKN